jgi:hypothetical protein
MVPLTSVEDLRARLKLARPLPPRVLSLKLPDGDLLYVGFGGKWGYVEHYQASTSVTRAILSEDPPDVECVAFLMGGVPSEIESDILLSARKVSSVLLRWYKSGSVLDTDLRQAQRGPGCKRHQSDTLQSDDQWRTDVRVLRSNGRWTGNKSSHLA